jgi:integrase/recombinase XerD
MMTVNGNPEAQGDGMSQELELTVPITSVDEGTALVRSYLATLGSPRSVSTMTESLVRVAKALGISHFSEIPWTKLDHDTLALIKLRLAAVHRPSTANLTLSAVRGVLKTGFLMGKVPQETLAIARELGGVRGSRIAKGRALSNKDIRALLVAATMFDEPKATMLHTILLLAIGTGLRREELCSLSLACVDDVRGGSLRVVGKGNKERPCPLDEPTKQALLRWFDVRLTINWPHRMLFASPSQGNPLSKQTLWWLMQELASVAKVKRFSPHDLRRTCGTGLYQKGLETREIQVILGHARPETTVLYDKRDPERIAERRRTVRIYDEPEEEPEEESE